MDDNRPLRVGLIGAGRIGTIHAETIAWHIPGAELVAVCDVNASAAAACATRFGVSRVVTDDADITGSTDLDAVLICSATDTHARLIEQSAAGGHAIFCEKPIDFDLDNIDRALSAVERAGVPLQIGFNRRFDPNFQEVRNQVAAGRVGAPHIMRITSRDPAPPPLDYIRVSGGMFFDMTIHDFDMARFLLGCEVETIHAVGGVRVDPAIGVAGDIDTAVITLTFDNGAIGTIDNSRQAVYGYDQRVEVFGSGGMARAENETPHRTRIADAEGVHHPLPQHFFLERYAVSYRAQLHAFVDAVVEGRPPSVTGADGRIAVVMARAAARSLELGRPVRVAEV